MYPSTRDGLVVSPAKPRSSVGARHFLSGNRRGCNLGCHWPSQLKLAELIVAIKGAENRLATVEELSEEELKELQEGYRLKAQSPDGAQKKNGATNAKILPAR